MHLNSEQGHEKRIHLKVNASYSLKTYAMIRVRAWDSVRLVLWILLLNLVTGLD